MWKVDRPKACAWWSTGARSSRRAPYLLSKPHSEWPLRRRGQAFAAEAGIRTMPLVHRLARSGGAADPRRRCRSNSASQRSAWGIVPARSGRTLLAGWLALGRKPLILPFLPIHRWGDLERGEYRQLRRTAGTRSCFATPDPDLRLGTAPGRSRRPVILGGFFGRPLQIPSYVASGDFLSRFYRARQREALLRRRRPAPLRGPTPGRWGRSSTTCAGSCASTTTAATPLYVTELGWGSRSGPTRWERGL